MSVPTVLLTRPRAASLRFAEGLPEGTPVVIAPLMDIVLHACPPIEVGCDVIVTSRHAVDAAGAALDGRKVHVVGAATAEAVRGAGGAVGVVAPDARALARELVKAGPASPLVYLRGAHVAGALSEGLRTGGFNLREEVVYDQPARDLSAQARALLAGSEPVLWPLFSPRSAALAAQAAGAARAPITALALSARVAACWPGTARIAEAPDARAMQLLIRAALE